MRRDNDYISPGSSGTGDQPRDAEHVADDPRLAMGRRPVLLEQADMFPERACAAIGADDAREDAHAGARGVEGRELRRVRCERAQVRRGRLQESRPEPAPPVGGDHAERQHVHLDRRRRRARPRQV